MTPIAANIACGFLPSKSTVVRLPVISCASEENSPPMAVRMQLNRNAMATELIR